MEIIVVRDDHLPVSGQLEVHLEGMYSEIQRVLHRADGILRHQAGAAAVGLQVDFPFTGDQRQTGEQEKNCESFHICFSFIFPQI